MSPRLALRITIACIFTVASINGGHAVPVRAEGDDLGAALAAAVTALDADPGRADALLASIDTTLLPDYVSYFQGVAKQAMGDEAGARERFERVLAAHADSPVAIKAAARLAPLLLAAGQTARVLDLAKSHASTDIVSADGAVIALAAGKALADSERAKAADWLARARRMAPGSASGSEAESLLSDLRRFSPELRPTSAEEMLAEARLAAREGDTQGAEMLLDGILSRHGRDPLAADAAIMRARMIAAKKGRAESAAWLEERAEHVQARDTKARILFGAASDRWNIDDTKAAQAVFERVAAMGAAAEAQRARYALGRIHENDARYSAAAEAYAAAGNGPDAQVARESRWRAGWVAYRAEDFPLAAARFARIASEGTKEAREEAMYWQARSLERAVDIPRAQILYRQVISEFPDGFYAYLAEPRAQTSAPPPTPARADTNAPLSAASATAVRRAEVLEQARLHDYAVAELRSVLSPASATEQRALLPALMRIAAYPQALQTALGLFRRGEMTENQLYDYLYPHAFAEIVDREARARSIDPYLVYSLIRQESLFDRRAVSASDAYGLMQLLLSTARRVASNDATLSGVLRDDLFEPEVNIRLGVAYLAELAQRFDGNEILMLAGYNAGEQAAERWRTRFGDLPPDEFVEQITYRETRDYVKKVLRNYRNYRRLYGGGDTLPQPSEQAPR